MEDREIIDPSVLTSMLMRFFEFAPMAMAITTSDTRTSSYAKVNDAYLKLTGLRWEDICGRTLISEGSAIDSPARDRRHRMLAEEGSYVLEEVDIRHADGTVIPTLISAQRTVVDGVSFDVEVIIDVSTRVRHQHEMESALLESARTDFLTGLPNRAGFEAELARRLSAPLEGRELALVYIDLNGFKPVNDGMGHAAGDEVLKTIASRLRENFRTGDYIARLGGDEFVMLLDADARKLAGLLQNLEAAAEHIFKPVAIDGLVADVGAAIGVALLQADDSGITFTKRADSYMYIAKATRQRVAIVALGTVGGDLAPVEMSKQVSGAL